MFPNGEHKQIFSFPTTDDARLFKEVFREVILARLKGYDMPPMGKWHRDKNRKALECLFHDVVFQRHVVLFMLSTCTPEHMKGNYEDDPRKIPGLACAVANWYIDRAPEFEIMAPTN